MRRLGGVLVVAILLAGLAQLLWRSLMVPSPGPPSPAPRAVAVEGGAVGEAGPGPGEPAGVRGGCASPRFAAATMRNAESLSTAAWSVSGRPESGWEIYAPLAARELGTVCTAASEGFAEALAAWQATHAIAPTGVMDETTLRALDIVWLRRRPFVAASSGGACPPPPAPDQLVPARPEEGYGGEPIRLRAGALAAYRRMVAAARAEAPGVFADRRLLTIFSGYRDPAADDLRCGAGGCDSIARARCSAHRTGLAMDLYLGAAPGFAPESAEQPNRLYQARSAAYRWLVENAARFGFVAYPFEPWHWEWTGEAP